MKTLNNTLVTAIQALLITTMPKSTTVATEHMAELLSECVAANLPLVANKLTEETRAILTATCSLRGGAMFDTLSDDITINIPTFNKATKAEATDVVVERHSVTFKLPSYDAESVRYFALAMRGLVSVQPDWDIAHNDFCKLTALVDFVIPTLRGLAVVNSSSAVNKDYLSICHSLQLGFVTLIKHVTFDNHTTGEGKTGVGITVIVPKEQRADVEAHLTAAKAKNTFNYINDSLPDAIKYDVVRGTVQDEDGIETVALKYRFTQTKA